MKVRTRWFAAGAAAAACCVLGFSSLAQQQDKAGMDAQAAMDAAMEEWMRLSTPNENHKLLEKWAGNWKLKITHWMAPGMPPSESEATAHSQMIMGGRYLVEDVRGTFEAEGRVMELEGRSTMGYDIQKEKFFSTWIDNFGTGMVEEWGTREGDKLITMGESYNPMVGGMQKTRSVAMIVDANTRKLEMYKGMPDGSWYKEMEITYTRQ